MREPNYPRDRLYGEAPADMRVHGDTNCASTERFTCRACRRSVCWCKGQSSRSHLDSACCDDCSVLLTESEWERVITFEYGLNGEWMSHTTALRRMRSRARSLAFAAAYADRARTAGMRFTP